MRLRCGCDPDQPAAADTRCPEGLRLVRELRKVGGGSTLAGHKVLVEIGRHRTSEEQRYHLAYSERLAA